MRQMRVKRLDLPAARQDVVRADLVFYGVDHSGPTYQARVFLNNPKATEETPLTAEEGYAGAFTVFGHGGCFGAEGHCAPKDRYTDEFDRRPPHPLTPQTVWITITDALARVAADQVEVNVVPVVSEGMAALSGISEVAGFERVKIVTYA